MASRALADRFDHIVLTVRDIDTTLLFYERALGFESEKFHGSDGQLRYALRFGNHKINLQDRDTETANKAQAPTFGSADFCLIAAIPLEEVVEHLRAENIPTVAGPVTRHGAVGPMRSIYFRDPDGNLVEVSEYNNSR
jgi:catechol 2,3-dioxygenase-like lactoylglutathione lyase family enzyme